MRRVKIEVPEHIANAAGMIDTRPTAPGGTLVTVYDAIEQGIDVDDGGRWMIVCEAHGTNVQMTNKRDALSVIRSKDSSTVFCDCCRATCVEHCFVGSKCPDCGREGQR